MKIRVRLNRSHEIQKIRGNLEREGLPRLQMTLLVLITGIAGFMASYVFLRVGMAEMWLRYLASFGIAYLVFLFLLWLWLRTRAEDYVDAPDLLNAMPSGNGSHSAGYGGNGGDFGGGGASSFFDAPPEGVPIQGDAGLGDAGDVVGEAMGAAAQAEELAIPLIALILIVALMMSSLLIIYSAPALFAELMLDGVLSASLYHRLRGLETRHWLDTAIRRTVWPFLVTALMVSASGWLMALYAPGAHTLGEVLVYAK